MVAVISEIISIKGIVIANSLNMIDTNPLVSKRGKNIATVVIVDAKIACPTSCAPKIDASLLLSPASLCLNIFSKTTTALSTTIPTAIAIAERETILRVPPERYR
ncbi:hypothetical protein ES703_65985 [subsurface metagenome]